MKSVEEFKSEYEQKFPIYTDFCKELVNQLNFLIQENNIDLGFGIESRVKSFDSIKEKIDRNDLNLKSILDINDFAGIRIICLFYKDLEAVTKLLEENLIVHKKENTIDRLKDNSFGYESIHFEASPKKEWLKIPTFKKHANCKVEIQLRTAAQHIWAAVSHTLQYKKESDIPLQLRRTIHRSAALLETVDLEFERVQNERAKYLDNLKDTSIDNLLNIDNLKYTLDANLPAENKRQDEPYSDLLEDLQNLGVTTTDSLDALLKKHLKTILDKNSEYVQKKIENKLTASKLGYYHSGLTRIMLREEFKEKAISYFTNEYSAVKKEKK